MSKNKFTDERYNEQSKDRLLKISETKIKTAFIGAISSFEEAFGYLWGHNSPNPTAEQRRNKDIWDRIRKEIFDKGNNQIRGLKNEFDYYTIHWDRYYIEFRQPHTRSE